MIIKFCPTGLSLQIKVSVFNYETNTGSVQRQKINIPAVTRFQYGIVPIFPDHILHNDVNEEVIHKYKIKGNVIGKVLKKFVIWDPGCKRYFP